MSENAGDHALRLLIRAVSVILDLHDDLMTGHCARVTPLRDENVA